MSGSNGKPQVVFQDRRYPTDQKHVVDGVLQTALNDFEAVAFRFSSGFIKDADLRDKYAQGIRRVSDEVQRAAGSGEIYIKDGVEYANMMRDKIMLETRESTSALGVAMAETKKQTVRGLDYYLDKYAEKNFGKPFSELSSEEVTQVYWAVIKSSGRANADVTASTKRLRLLGRAGIIMTALLAGHDIWVADDRKYEVAHQGAILAGGLAGGAIAGLAVGALCGPAAPICVAAVLFIGSSAGGLVADKLTEDNKEEIQELIKWGFK